MTLEKLIGCACRHTIDFHDDFGCHGRGRSDGLERCPCALRPSDVVDGIIAIELAASERRWSDDRKLQPRATP